MSGPRVYAVPPGVPFAEAFARGFWSRHAGCGPAAPARGRVLLNTPRSLRLVEEALVDKGPGNALLPRLGTLTDLGGDPLAAPDILPAIAPLRRQLRLIRLVERYLAAERGAEAAAASAPALAAALETLLDECDEAGLDAAALDHATGGAHAAHWQRTLAFVDLVRRHWPAIRAEEEGGAPDPRARQRAVIERMVAEWRTRPPTGPVIAAGSTGAVASTGLLLAAIARLPGGAVVLPGLDTTLPDGVWAEIARGDAPEHPQAPFGRLLQLLDLTPGDVAPWEETAPPAPRLALMTQALRPAPVTDAWRAALPALAAEVSAATADLTLVEAASPRQEAAAVALAIRRGLDEPGTRIALVTPDAALARRVTAELARFEVLPDDSLGRPLSLTPPAVFLRLLARIAADGAELGRLGALLQHPLMTPGVARRDHLGHARAYDRAVLRKPGAMPPAGCLPPWPEAGAEASAWLAAIEAGLAPLVAALEAGAPLAAVAAAQHRAAEALSRETEGAEPRVWAGADGAVAREVVEGLIAEGGAHGPEATTAWPALLDAMLGQREVRPAPTAPHPRVTILGPREGRTQAADLVILSGLNEGTWPALPDADPWLSRPMRRAVGLPEPEARIGLSAHDFYHAALRGRVFLTRSLRVEGTPTIASRWLIRLENLLGGIDDGAALAAMRVRGQALLGVLEHVHAPTAPTPRAPRPMPSPAVLARPRRLSVTDVETLIRDAYAIYARKILNLAPLDPPGRAPDYRDRGTVFHAVLERFVEETRDAWPGQPAAKAHLMTVADAVLAERVPAADLRRIWRARLARAADWFIAQEDERRAGARPGAVETKGVMEFDAPAGPFTLSAKADRIDLRADGRAAIIDYKTGKIPTRSEIDAGFAQQLHLQAAILAAGGFADIPARETAVGEYIGLTGAGDGGNRLRREGLGAEVSEHTARLISLIAAYDQGAAYIARGRPQMLSEEGDYDHLSRRREWEGEDE